MDGCVFNREKREKRKRGAADVERSKRVDGVYRLREGLREGLSGYRHTRSCCLQVRLSPSQSTAFRRKWFRGFSPVPMTPFFMEKRASRA